MSDPPASRRLTGVGRLYSRLNPGEELRLRPRPPLWDGSLEERQRTRCLSSTCERVGVARGDLGHERPRPIFARFCISALEKDEGIVHAPEGDVVEVPQIVKARDVGAAEGDRPLVAAGGEAKVARDRLGEPQRGPSDLVVGNEREDAPGQERGAPRLTLGRDRREGAHGEEPRLGALLRLACELDEERYRDLARLTGPERAPDLAHQIGGAPCPTFGDLSHALL